MNQDIEHFRNLISLAAVDGKVEEIERVTLSKLAFEKGISVDRMNVMLKHADEYTLIIPQNNKDRDRQLQDMIDFALVDGEFAQAERGLIITVGERLGYSKDELFKIIENYLMSKSE